MSDAISISGYIPTSGDTDVSTIETFDLENIGRGLYWLNFYYRCHITQDTGGGNFTPARWTLKGVKKILDNGARHKRKTIGLL